MMVFPSTIPRAHALVSNGTNYWSAYGPNTDNLLYTVYQDFANMFTAFNSGQLDITDWPIQPGDLANYIGNPDFFVTPKLGDFGIFQLDINHQSPFLNIALQVARSTTGGTTPGTTGSPAFAPGTPTLTITSTCALPCPPLPLSSDPHIKFIDSPPAATPNAPGTWAPGKGVVYDGDGDGVYNAEGTPTDPVISGSGLPDGVNLSIDPKIRFIDDFPANGIWNTGEAVIYEGSATVFTSGTTPPVCLSGQQCTADFSVNYNSPSTKKPSVAGVEIVRALSHLLDKPSYLTGSYLTPPGGTPLATCDDVQAPPSQSLTITIGTGACALGSSVVSVTLQADCADHADIFGTSGQIGGPTCSPVSLYNLKADSVSGASSCVTGTVGVSCFPSQSASPPTAGYSGTLDLAATCESFVSAGFTTTNTGSVSQQCTSVARGTGHVVNPAGGCTPSTGVGCIELYIRTNEPRKAFGTIVADELNFLFGTPGPSGGTICYGGPPALSCSLSPVYFTIDQIDTIIFDVSTVADWNLYTGGFTLSPTPDHLHSLYHSQFAGNLCGGTTNSQPNNYPLWCDPVYDTQANVGENVQGVTLSGFRQAAIVGTTRGITVPVYSGLNQFAALNAWNWQPRGSGTGSSLVTVKG